MNLSKQALLIDENKLNNWTIHIFGLGSIGSHLGLALAKTGFKNIVGYDYDTVDEDNIPAQAYGIKHIGLKKTQAFQQLLNDECDIIPLVYDEKIDENTIINVEPNAIYFCAFDSIECRKIVYDKLKIFNVIWGESRIGIFDYRYYFVSEKTPEKWKEEYEKMLQPGQPSVDLKCGEKCCYGSNIMIVSRILRQILNIIEEKEFTYMFIGNWLTENIIERRTE